MPDQIYELGTVEASEAIIQDLYLSLRDRLFRWSRVTKQTPQPKMGYIGQHLTSVVTGYPGGRSGARGKDLILPDGESAEIKTCYRVDQLGACNKCGSVVASVETECAVCGSEDVQRKDDSKWLLSPRHDEEMQAFFDPRSYYFVLFDFENLDDPTTINVRIWEVDPKSAGFVYCMADYYGNIRSRSTSKAPFNLWPFSLKFQLMRPTLIYYSKIDSENQVDTLIFPGQRGEPVTMPLAPLTEFKRTSGFTLDMAKAVASRFVSDRLEPMTKSGLLDLLQTLRTYGAWDEDELVSVVRDSMYRDLISNHEQWIPVDLRLSSRQNTNFPGGAGL